MTEFRVNPQDPVDVMALALVSMGFYPSESLVVLFSGVRGEVAGARFDLDRALGLSAVELLDCMECVGMQVRGVVAYSADPESGRALLERLPGVGARVWVGADQCAVLDTFDGWADPVDLPELTKHPMVREYLARGGELAASRDEVVADATGPNDPQAAERACAAIERFLPDDEDDQWADVMVWLHQSELSEPQAREMGMLLDEVGVRDRVLVTLTRENAARMRARVVDAVRVVPVERAGGALLVLTFCALLMGDGVLVTECLERAERSNRGAHRRLAAMVGHGVERGIFSPERTGEFLERLGAELE